MNRRVHILKAPTSLFLAITGKCNLNCKHCNVGDHQNRNYFELSTEQWLNFFSEMERLKIFRCRISGGEPFMRKDFFDLLDDLQKRNIWVDINTNGILITEEKAKRLSRYKYIGNIMVSLDGSNPETYESIRGKGTFQHAMRGIKYLSRYNGRRVSFYCSLGRTNVHDMENMIIFVNQLPVSGIKFNFIMPGGNANQYLRYLSLTDEERRKTSFKLFELSEKYNKISGTVLDTYEMFKDFEKKFNKYGKPFPPPAPVRGCNTVRTEVTVRFEGNVTPCDRLSHMVCGNILQQPLEDIWLNSPVLNDFRKRMEMNLDRLQGCENCEYNFMCTGGCPAIPDSVGKGIYCYDPMSCFKVYNLEIPFFRG